MAKQKLTLFALALLVAMHSTLLSAQPNSLQQSAMSWPMQQGESLNDVARLFYPKNQYMQRQFVIAAIKLNQDTQPDLNASMVFTQESTIAIPDIKALSRKSQRKPVQIPGKIAVQRVSADASISAKLQADYENLLQRNEFFKQELDKLNARLTQLQQVFAALKVDLMRLINSPPPEPAMQATSAQTAQAIQQVQPVPQADVPAKPAQIVKANPEPKSVNAANTPDGADKVRASSIYLWMPILITLFVLALLIGFMLYSRRQAEKLRFATSTNLASLKKKTFFETVFSIHRPAPPAKTVPLNVQSEFSGSISEAPPLVVMDEKEESELMLEQAKIYVNLGRHEDAIRLLNVHINAAPTAALQHWLYLLDIYRDTDQKEAFEESAKALHQTFNVEMPQWEKVSTVDEFFAPAHTLEEYGYIVNKVTQLWADCEKETDKMMQTKNYLDNLLTDTRNHERTGFTMDVFEEIVLLRDMLDAREKLAQEV